MIQFQGRRMYRQTTGQTKHFYRILLTTSGGPKTLIFNWKEFQKIILKTATKTTTQYNK